ncbi:MAG TPA: GspMb/PilO family protein [Candidatus Angelobacter sp.]
MGNLRRVNQRFILLAAVLSAANLLLLVFLFWAGSSGPSRDVLQARRDALKTEVERWRKSDPDQMRAALEQFYSNDLPSRYSQIAQQVDKLVHDAGVTAQAVRYVPADTEKSAPPGVQEIKIETTVTGEYTKVARFINALEQDKMLFIIEKISLTGEQGGVVSLQITFNTFLKQAA